jgi:dihydrofolate reductase
MSAVQTDRLQRDERRGRSNRGAAVATIADITISLDGFVTARDAGPDAGLGVGGEPLHRWVFGGAEVDEQVLRRSFDRSGAVVMGRNTFDVVDGPHGWGDDIGYGRRGDAQPPMVVVTHQPPESVRLVDRFRFAGDLEDGIAQAAALAGDKDVVLMGGGNLIGQAVRRRLIDELVLHVSPVIFGTGTPLFAAGEPLELEQVDVVVSPFATHVTYRLPHA